MMSASGPLERSVSLALERASLAREGGAFSAVLAEEALLEAARADERLAAGSPRRPLEGVTLAVKDLLAIAGQPIGAGSASRAGALPEPADASFVAALRRLGAVVVGRAALHELAFGVTGVNAYEGTPLNPLDPALVPGGSSSGSALAVAGGSAVLAVGTDTGGSVRIPAACCGVVGFKPARGEYPLGGVLPLAPSLDHVGLLAATLEPIRRAHAALGADAGAPGLPIRVGLDEGALAQAEPALASAVEAVAEALEDAGAVVSPAALPAPGLVGEVSTVLLFAEAARTHGAGARADPARYGADVRARLERGCVLAADRAALESARRAARTVAAELDRVLDGCDVVISPTLRRPPPAVREASDERLSADLVAFTRLYNLTGKPALSLPLGAGPGIALQLAARDSTRLLAAGAAIEALLAGGKRPGADDSEPGGRPSIGSR